MTTIGPVSAISQPALGGAPRIDRVTAWSAGLIALSLAAWVTALIVMAGMDQGPGTPLHDFPTFLIGWVIMLTAMMLPSELAYLRAYARLLGARRRAAMLGAFLAGYGLAWIAYGGLAFGLDAIIRETLGAAILRSGSGPALAGAVLVAAGLYQLSQLKQACLTHCRAPISYFARRWRPGAAGALRMGLTHGLVCVGCCWALMAVMFAVGAMSLTWMGLLTVVMFAEKVLPVGSRTKLAIAAGLIAMGLWIALSPDTAPLMMDPLVFGSAICRAF